jgi:hypothetical protein
MRTQFLIPALTVLAALPALAVEDAFTSPLDTSVWTVKTSLAGARVSCPLSDAGGADGSVLELVYPGPTSPKKYGPGLATQVSRFYASSYGAYEARLKTANASSKDGVVSAFFTYFNDGSDQDGDGMADNSEIDFEFLSAEPGVIYMTVWTDYEVLNGEEFFYHTSRRIELTSGRVWQTEPGTEGQYGPLIELDPLPVAFPDYKHSAAFVHYGFDWSETNVTFWLDFEDGSGPVELWSFDGEPNVSIPTRPAKGMFNVWHNQNDWVTGKPARPPGSSVSYRVDWTSQP